MDTENRVNRGYRSRKWDVSHVWVTSYDIVKRAASGDLVREAWAEKVIAVKRKRPA